MKFSTLLAISTTILFTSCGGDDDDDDNNNDTERLPKAIKDINGERFMSSVLADFDGDGDLDLMLGGLDRAGIERDRLLLNDGTGKYTLAPEENMPLRFGGDQYGSVQLRAGDFDGDGDNDVLAGVHGPLPSTDATVMLYINDGNGIFSDGSSKVNYVSSSNGGDLIIGNLELGDIDDDGDTDFIVIQGGGENGIYLNDGSGNFSIANFTGLEEFGLNTTFHANAADVDGDNDTDLIAVRNVFINDGGNNYTTVTNFENFYEPMFSAVLKNASGGNPILVGVQFIFLDEIGASVKAFQVNDGGELADVSTDVFSAERNTIHPRNLYVADFDGNGTDDVVIADHGLDNFPFPGTQNTLLLQQSDGTLVDASNQLPQVSDFTHDIAIGDIDGDGDIDIYASNLAIGTGADQTPYFMINDGSGRFTLED